MDFEDLTTEHKLAELNKRVEETAGRLHAGLAVLELVVDKLDITPQQRLQVIQEVALAASVAGADYGATVQAVAEHLLFPERR